MTTRESKGPRWAITASALAVLLTAGVANAQPQTTTGPVVITPGRWSVTPFIGFGFSGDLDSGTGGFGLATGYNWDRRVSIEGELNMLPSSESDGAVEVDSKVWNFTGNLLYHFAERPFVPYAAVGLGFGQANVDFDDSTFDAFDDSSTSFIVNFGGGVQRRIRQNIGFRGDLRYFTGGNLVPDHWRLAAGLSFHLGAR